MNVLRKGCWKAWAMWAALALLSPQVFAGVNNVCISCWSNFATCTVGVSTNPTGAVVSNAMSFSASAGDFRRVWFDPCCNVSKPNDVGSGNINSWAWSVVGNTAPNPASGTGPVASFTNFAVGTGLVTFVGSGSATISGQVYPVVSTGKSPGFLVMKLSFIETNILACVGANTNAQLSVTPASWTNIAWQLAPALSGGARFTTNSTGPGSSTTWPAAGSLRVSPGNIITSYVVTVRAQPYTNCYDEAQVRVVGVEIGPTNLALCAGSSSNAVFAVTPDSWTNVLWEIEPTNLSGGATIAAQTPTNVEINPGTLGTGYTVRATAVENPSQTDEATLDVILLEIGSSADAACACTSGCDVTFWLTNSYAPGGVTWSITPPALPGGASIVSTSETELVLQPGSVATSYTIRATAKANTNCYEETELDVLPIVVSPSLTNACACTNSCSVEFSVAMNSVLSNGVFWGIAPSNVVGGAEIIGATTTTVTVLPGAVGTNYTVFAWSLASPSCVGTAGLRVVSIKVAPAETNACACSNGCDVVFALTNTHAPAGVTWEIEPEGLAGGAVIWGASNSAAVSPGTVITTYTVRARSLDNTNCMGEAVLHVLPVEITPALTNACAACTSGCEVAFGLVANAAVTGVTWQIEPVLTNGASVSSATSTQLLVSPGTLGTSYVIRAVSQGNTNCADTAELRVIALQVAPATTNVCACTNACDAAFSLTNSYAPGGVTWEIEPSGLTGGATISGSSNSATVNAGALGTTYIVRARSAVNSACVGEATVVVCYVDLRLDSDNNGAIQESDDPVETNSPGKLIYLNQDDDNTNDVADLTESSVVAGEDDLQQLNLAFGPSDMTNGMLTLSAPTGGTCLQIWSNAAKGTALQQIALPKSWNLASEKPPASLFIEGIQAGSAELQLALAVSGTAVCIDHVLVGVVGVGFQKRADTSFGYDDGTVDDNPVPTSSDNPPQKYDWASVDRNSKTTSVDVVVSPASFAQYVCLGSSDSAKMEVSPTNASSSPQALSIGGRASGTPYVWTRLGGVLGAEGNRLNVGVYKLASVDANFYKVAATNLVPDATTANQFETGANEFLALGVCKITLIDNGTTAVEYDTNSNSRLDIDTDIGGGGEWDLVTAALAAPAGQKVLHVKNSLRVRIAGVWHDATGLNWGDWIIVTDASLSKTRTLAHEILHNQGLRDTGPPGSNDDNVMYFETSATKYFVGYFKVEAVQTGSGNSFVPKQYERQWDTITR